MLVTDFHYYFSAGNLICWHLRTPANIENACQYWELLPALSIIVNKNLFFCVKLYFSSLAFFPLFDRILIQTSDGRLEKVGFGQDNSSQPQYWEHLQILRTPANIENTGQYLGHLQVLSTFVDKNWLFCVKLNFSSLAFCPLFDCILI